MRKRQELAAAAGAALFTLILGFWIFGPSQSISPPLNSSSDFQNKTVTVEGTVSKRFGGAGLFFGLGGHPIEQNKRYSIPVPLTFHDAEQTSWSYDPVTTLLSTNEEPLEVAWKLKPFGLVVQLAVFAGVFYLVRKIINYRLMEADGTRARILAGLAKDRAGSNTNPT